MSGRGRLSAGSGREESGGEEQEFETLVEMQLRSHPLGADWGRVENRHSGVEDGSRLSPMQTNQLLLRERFSLDSKQASEADSQANASGRNIENQHYRYESRESDLAELRPVGFGDIKTMFQREIGKGQAAARLFGLQGSKERSIHSHQITGSLISEDVQNPSPISWRDMPQRREPTTTAGEPPLTFGDSARKRHTHRSTEGNLKSSRHESVLKSVTAEAENDVANKIGNVPSMDECIELVQEALEEIYQEKMQEIERSYLVQIEALNKEIQRLHAEMVDSTISPLSEQDYRLGDLELELKEKYDHMEATLFEKYKRDTEEAVRRVEDEMEQILEGRGLTRARRQQLEFDFVESLEKKYQKRSQASYEVEQSNRLEVERTARSKARQASSSKNSRKVEEESKISEELKRDRNLLDQEKCEIGRIKSLLAVNMKKVKETQKRLELKESELDQKLAKLNSLMKHGTKLQRMRAEKVIKTWEDRQETASRPEHDYHAEGDSNTNDHEPEADQEEHQQENPLTTFEYGISANQLPRDARAPPKPSIQKTKPDEVSKHTKRTELVTFADQKVDRSDQHQIEESESNPLASYIRQSATKQDKSSVLNFKPGQNFDNYIQSKLNDLQRARAAREQALKKEAEMDFEIKKNSHTAASLLIEDQNHRLTLSNLEVPRVNAPSVQSPNQRVMTDNTANELNHFLEQTMQQLGQQQSYSPLGMSGNHESKVLTSSAEHQRYVVSPSSHSVQSRATAKTNTDKSVSVNVKISSHLGANLETNKRPLEYLKPRPASLLTQVFLNNPSPGTAIHQQYQKVCEQLIHYAEEWPSLLATHKDFVPLLTILEDCMVGVADAKAIVTDLTQVSQDAQRKHRLAAEIDYWQKFKSNHKEILQKLKRREGIRSQIGSLAMEFSGVSDIEEFIQVSGSCYTLLRAVDSGLKGMSNKGVQYKGIKIDLLLKLDAYEEDFLHKIHAQDIKERYK